jgi:hypothetical protein
VTFKSVNLGDSDGDGAGALLDGAGEAFVGDDENATGPGAVHDTTSTMAMRPRGIRVSVPRLAELALLRPKVFRPHTWCTVHRQRSSIAYTRRSRQRLDRGRNAEEFRRAQALGFSRVPAIIVIVGAR